MIRVMTVVLMAAFAPAYAADGAANSKAAGLAVDRALVGVLKDPTSVSQYRISNVLSCDSVFPHPMSNYAPAGCVCYQVNAKNSYGAYTGLKFGAATLSGTMPSYVAAIREPSELVYNLDSVCESAGMQKRDPALLKAAM